MASAGYQPYGQYVTDVHTRALANTLEDEEDIAKRLPRLLRGRPKAETARAGKGASTTPAPLPFVPLPLQPPSPAIGGFVATGNNSPLAPAGNSYNHLLAAHCQQPTLILQIMAEKLPLYQEGKGGNLKA